MSMQEQRILIECTQTFFRGGNSGIQRVARNIANQALHLKHPNSQIVPVIWVGYGFCAVRNKVGTGVHYLLRLRDWINEKRGGSPGRLISLLIRILKLPLKLLRPLRPWRGIWDKMIRDIKASLIGIGYGLGYLAVRFLFGPILKLRQGDTVLLIDSTWGAPDMLESLFQAQREHGVKVAPMLHDLFPLTMPETCEAITVEYYTRWFHRVVPRADFFVTNSKATGTSLERYLEQHPEIRALPVLHHPFRLGAELDLLQRDRKDPEEIQPLWETPGRAILAIGTIEPRKNHRFLLDVFDLLRARGVDVSLILIGRFGWKSQDVVDRIQSHPDLNTRLLHLFNASDAVLAEAIARADCLVCASVAEGFGLPVVEGLMRGNEVFASDIEVFREIGEGKCHFFRLDDPTDLADQLERWFIEKDRMISQRDRSPFSWPNWKESAEELVSVTLSLLQKKGGVDSRSRTTTLATSAVSEHS
ncbi:MAG: glycosyltransferase family 4 protein [Pirellulaceae bacterium]|jgi:glycosyltransferase involved in cell wall biosynthesis